MYSSEQPKRGFLPPQNQEETLIMRRAEDLYRSALQRGQARFSGFLSDRQQVLCKAALDKLRCDFYSFDGGYPEAQRRMLCLTFEEDEESPLCFVKITAGALSTQTLTHQDYLGALMGLSVERECLGDVIILPGTPQVAYVAVLERMAGFLERELTEVGRNTVKTTLCSRDEVEWGKLPQPEVKTATVSSLRLDSVLAAMLNTSRGLACELIKAGRVEIGHVLQSNAHAPVYEGDIFSIRGKGKFQLKAIGGRSRKDRIFIEFFKY